MNRNRRKDVLEMSEKKRLSAKEYLEQLELIDENINQDLQRLSDMKTDATKGGGIDYSKVRVQTSLTGSKLENDVVRYISLDEHINREVDQFVDAKERIIRQIRGLHNKDYVRVLYKVYVQYKSLKVAAAEMKRSYNFTIEVHGKALEEFEKMYSDLVYLC